MMGDDKIVVIMLFFTGLGTLLGWVGAHLKLEQQVRCYHMRGRAVPSSVKAPLWICQDCGAVLQLPVPAQRVGLD